MQWSFGNWLTRVNSADKNRVTKASQLLEKMQKLVNDYGAVLAGLKSTGGFISVERLPASKLEIKHALIAAARVAQYTGDISSVDSLHKGYAFLAYFVSHEEAETMNRFNGLIQAGVEKDVSDARIAEIAKEMSKDNQHSKIAQRSVEEFNLLFREFDAEIAQPIGKK
jgi:hypothetical protein